MYKMVCNCAGITWSELPARTPSDNPQGRKTEQHTCQQPGRNKNMRLWRIRSTHRLNGKLIRWDQELHVTWALRGTDKKVTHLAVLIFHNMWCMGVTGLSVFCGQWLVVVGTVPCWDEPRHVPDPSAWRSHPIGHFWNCSVQRRRGRPHSKNTKVTRKCQVCMRLFLFVGVHYIHIKRFIFIFQTHGHFWAARLHRQSARSQVTSRSLLRRNARLCRPLPEEKPQRKAWPSHTHGT